MKGILKKVIVLLFILFLILLITFIVNERFIAKYEDGEYDDAKFSTLRYEVLEPYKSYYNQGNVYYKKKDFKKAVSEYEKALKLFPSHDDECKIRINLALAKLQLIDYTMEKQDDVDRVIKELEKVQKVLTEEGCAKSNGKGHNKKAQILYDEIQEYIDQLKQEPPPEDPTNVTNDTNSTDNNTTNDPIPDPNMINDIETNAMGNMSDPNSSTYDPYSGKPW